MDPITLGMAGAGLLSGIFGGGGQKKLQKQQLQIDRDRLTEQKRQFDQSHAFDRAKYGDERASGILGAQRDQTAEATRMVGQNMLNPSRHQLIASLMSRFGGGGQSQGQILQQLQNSPRVRPTTDYNALIQRLRSPLTRSPFALPTTTPSGPSAGGNLMQYLPIMMQRFGYGS